MCWPPHGDLNPGRRRRGVRFYEGMEVRFPQTDSLKKLSPVNLWRVVRIGIYVGKVSFIRSI